MKTTLNKNNCNEEYSELKVLLIEIVWNKIKNSFNGKYSKLKIHLS